MTCDEFDAQLDAYARGALTDADAFALEQHAAACAACAARLEQLPTVNVGAFDPALPPELRRSALDAVAARHAHSVRRRWTAGVVCAVAAVLAIVVLPRVTTRVRDGQVVALAHDTTPANASSASMLAVSRAQAEFDAIDAAERELRAALAATPGDVELRAFLSSVSAQRAELQRRVEAART